jgi:capsular polysaccharide biosynthesis protein
MEKITTFELMRAFKRNIKIIIFTVILFLALAFAYNKTIMGEQYTAQTVMIIVADDEKEISYNKILLNEKLSNIYSKIIESEDIYKDVLDDLNVKDISPDKLKSRLKTDVDSQAGIITFELTTDNMDLSADLLTDICEKFRAYIKKYLKTDNLEYLQKVTVKNVSSASSPKIYIAGGLVGFILALLIVCIKEVTSQKIRTASYVKELGLEVLGEVNEK